MGGRSVAGPTAQPVAEGQPGRRGPVRRARLPDAHELGVQRVGGPRVARVAVGPAGARVRPGSMCAHTCCRAERQPVGFPSRSGELANAATSTGPIACSSRQRERYPDPPAAVVAGVQADLDRRGAAHHLAAPRAVAVEEFLHRRVPREVEHAPGRAERIKAVAAELEPGAGGRVAKGGQVTPGHLKQLTERSRGRRAQLKLPAGLDRERGARGKRRKIRIPNEPAACSGSSWSFGGFEDPNPARVAATCSAWTGCAGSRRSRTSHSSSTPTRSGGPVLKQIPWTCASASASVNRAPFITIPTLPDRFPRSPGCRCLASSSRPRPGTSGYRPHS